jgi:hypothetical protein
MEASCHDLAEALRVLEERLAADFQGETSSKVDCAAKDDVAFLPPGLEVPSEQTTVAHASGATSNASTLSPPPGLNNVADTRDSDMPKKIPLPERPFDVLRAFQAGRPQVAENQSPKARPLKKFCAFCGMQVDPEYLAAKFCAFCGAEHVQINNSMVTPTAGVLPPTHHQACWQSFDDYSHSATFLHGEADFYDESLAWQGGATAWDTSEDGEFNTYDYSCPFSASAASSWPPQGMAW